MVQVEVGEEDLGRAAASSGRQRSGNRSAVMPASATAPATEVAKDCFGGHTQSGNETTNRALGLEALT